MLSAERINYEVAESILWKMKTLKKDSTKQA